MTLNILKYDINKYVREEPLSSPRPSMLEKCENRAYDTILFLHCDSL